MRIGNAMVGGEATLLVEWEGRLLMPGRVLAGLPATSDAVIAGGPEARRALEEACRGLDEEARARATVDETQLRYAPALLEPGHILCCGLNYALHVAEGQDGPRDLPISPVWFSKFPSCLSAHGDEVRLLEAAKEHDFEAEFVLVIGRRGHAIPVESALDHVWGLTLGNDLSARDLQRRSSQWLLGKNGDGFAPLGPLITPLDALELGALEIASYRGDERYQTGQSGEMIFDFATLIADISQVLTLEPGDLIFTGTPSGVIMGRPEGERRWLEAGDELRIVSPQLGELRTRIV